MLKKQCLANELTESFRRGPLHEDSLACSRAEHTSQASIHQMAHIHNSDDSLQSNDSSGKVRPASESNPESKTFLRSPVAADMVPLGDQISSNGTSGRAQ